VKEKLTKLPAPGRYYDVCVALFVMVLIVSNIASVKLVGVGSLIFDAGTILFPIAYILGDVITEVYGFKRLRRVLGLGVVMLLITMLTFWVVGLLPPASGWTGQEAFGSTLGVVWRIVLASVTAIALGELTNSYVMARLKVQTKGKYLWGRVIGSSAVGNAVDTTVFSVIAFAGTISGSSLLALIGTVYLMKMAAELVISPVTVRVVGWLKKREQIDVYEDPKFFS